MKLTHDTPMVKIGNYRQFQSFIRLWKSDQVRIGLFKKQQKTMKRSRNGENVNQFDYNHDEDTYTNGVDFGFTSPMWIKGFSGRLECGHDRIDNESSIIKKKNREFEDFTIW